MTDLIRLNQGFKKLISYVETRYNDEITLKAIDDDLKTLEGIIKRRRSNDFNVAVLAPMKAGKSTFVNALLGKDLMPNENEACTLFHTEIQLKRFDGVIRKVKTKGKPALIKGENISEEFQSDIRNCRELLENDPGDDRLNFTHYGVNHELFIKANSKEFSVKLIDSPGPNEMQIGGRSDLEVRDIFEKVLRMSSQIIYVLDIQYYKADENEKILQEILRVRPDIGKHIIFIVNKTDKFSTTKGVEIDSAIGDIKKFLSYIGFEENKIYPLSARSAMLARTINTALELDEKNMVYRLLNAMPFKGMKRWARSLSKSEKLLEKYRMELAPMIEYETREIGGEMLQMRPSPENICRQLMDKSNIEPFEEEFKKLIENPDTLLKEHEKSAFGLYESKLKELAEAFVEANNDRLEELKNSPFRNLSSSIRRALSSIDGIQKIKVPVDIKKEDIEELLKDEINYSSTYSSCFSSSNLPYYNTEWYEYCVEDEYVAQEESKPAEYRDELMGYFNSTILQLEGDLDQARTQVAEHYKDRIVRSFGEQLKKLEEELKTVYTQNKINYDFKLKNSFSFKISGSSRAKRPGAPYISLRSKSFTKTKGILMFKKEVSYVKYALEGVGDFKSSCYDRVDSYISDEAGWILKEMTEEVSKAFKAFIKSELNNHVEILNNESKKLEKEIKAADKEILRLQGENEFLGKLDLPGSNISEPEILTGQEDKTALQEENAPVEEAAVAVETEVLGVSEQYEEPSESEVKKAHEHRRRRDRNWFMSIYLFMCSIASNLIFINIFHNGIIRIVLYILSSLLWLSYLINRRKDKKSWKSLTQKGKRNLPILNEEGNKKIMESAREYDMRIKTHIFKRVLKWFFLFTIIPVAILFVSIMIGGFLGMALSCLTLMVCSSQVSSREDAKSSWRYCSKYNIDFNSLEADSRD